MKGDMLGEEMEKDESKGGSDMSVYVATWRLMVGPKLDMMFHLTEVLYRMILWSLTYAITWADKEEVHGSVCALVKYSRNLHRKPRGH